MGSMEQMVRSTDDFDEGSFPLCDKLLSLFGPPWEPRDFRNFVYQEENDFFFRSPLCGEPLLKLFFFFCVVFFSVLELGWLL